MREAAEAKADAAPDDNVRMGINLGPVKLVKDINGHPNIIGDGINVAQRIMSFARPGQIVVSRSYYDVVSNLGSGATSEDDEVEFADPAESEVSLYAWLLAALGLLGVLYRRRAAE